MLAEAEMKGPQMEGSRLKQAWRTHVLAERPNFFQRGVKVRDGVFLAPLGSDSSFLNLPP